jgi:hypothetical protein
MPKSPETPAKPPLDRSAIHHRTTKLGIRPLADALRNEIRARHLNTGATRNNAGRAAWDEMWQHVRPVVEHLEARAAKQHAANPDNPPEPALIGSPDDPTPHLDPDYSERDPGKRLRDGLLWTAEEIRRVVRDPGPHGATESVVTTTTIDLARAATPPPSAWAIFLLETYARQSPEDRAKDLIARVLPFATRDHDPIPQNDNDSPGGFLDQVAGGGSL